MNKPTVTGQNTNDLIAEAIDADIAQIDRKEYIEVVPNVRLHVRDWGAGQPIVFIHGWPFSDEVFEYQFQSLPQKGFRCIAITLRGFGKSDQPYGTYSYDVIAEDIKKVLSILDVDHCVMVGFSTGAAAAVSYLTHHLQARISKLILLSGTVPIFAKQKDYKYGIAIQEIDSMINLCSTDRAQLIINFSKLLFANPDKINTAIISWLHTLGMQASPNATVRSLIAMKEADFKAELKDLTLPTTIFHGVHDKISSVEMAKEMQTLIPGSQLLLFENSGHGLLLEEIEKCNQAIIDFAIAK